MAQDSKQNVLFIVIDDLKPLLGCYGDSTAKTPCMDRLGESGVLFNHCYCQQAICGPSRASLLTGLRPDHTKVWDLRTKMRDVNPQIVSLPQYFRQHGYETAGIGKVFDPRCVDRSLDSASWSIPFYKKSDDYFSKENCSPAEHWQDPTTVGLLKKYEKEAKAKGLEGAKARAYVRKHCSPTVECIDVPDNTYKDGAIVLHAADILTELKEGEKPFFLAVGIQKPHLPFAAPKKYWDMYQRDEVPLAQFRANAENSPKVAYQNGGKIFKYTDIPPLASFSDQKHGMLLPIEKQKELIHGYYAATSYADALVGQLLDTLKSLDLTDNTMVVVVGDHGWHLGDHNLWCKHTNFEQAVRSPLIISAPRIKASTTNAPVEFVDIFPTLADLAELDAPQNVDGKSLLPILKDSSARVKDYAISQYPRGSSPKRVMGYSIRTDEHRYTVWMEKDWVSTKPYDLSLQVANEFYDYQNDQLETRNLVDDPDFSEAVEEMRGKLLAFFASEVEK